MPGSKTAYLSQKQLDHALGGATWAPPGTIWFLASTAAFNPAATGAACAEVTAAGYARLTAPNNSTTWSAATAAEPSVKSNNDDLAWAAATADWGTPLSVYVADAATAGNLLYGADLSNTADVAIADTFKILAGTFVFSEA